RRSRRCARSATTAASNGSGTSTSPPARPASGRAGSATRSWCWRDHPEAVGAAAALRGVGRGGTVSAWAVFGIGAGVSSALMLLLWLVQVRIRDATHVDVGWAYG